MPGGEFRQPRAARLDQQQVDRDAARSHAVEQVDHHALHAAVAGK
jgi:hypothetical protein